MLQTGTSKAQHHQRWAQALNDTDEHRVTSPLSYGSRAPSHPNAPGGDGTGRRAADLNGYASAAASLPGPSLGVATRYHSAQHLCLPGDGSNARAYPELRHPCFSHARHTSLPEESPI